MALRLIRPALPKPPTWFPGHMNAFVKNLPDLLWNTDIVLELRDARLPLTSINGSFESALTAWKQRRSSRGLICERYVILNKRDLVPEWGIGPFKLAMLARYPEQKVLFTSVRELQDRRNLDQILVDVARHHYMREEFNVLVIGMPNVGKSTLLNALRTAGIQGRTAKAMPTSGHPGKTKVLSNRLKIHENPNIYAYDSPGIMLPFLGNGQIGSERGVKLCLIAGIKPKHYDPETLCSYLLYRMNVQNPERPFYLKFLAPGALPTDHVEIFLEALARKMSMTARGGVPDVRRASEWFIKWWRENGHVEPLDLSRSDWTTPSTSMSPTTTFPSENPDDIDPAPPLPLSTAGDYAAAIERRFSWGYDVEFTIDRPLRTRKDQADFLQRKMEDAMDLHAKELETEIANNEHVSQKVQGKVRKVRDRDSSVAKNSKLGKRIQHSLRKKAEKNRKIHEARLSLSQKILFNLEETSDS